MKITCTIDNVRAAIATVERFTSKHITLPILSHFLCKADEKRIMFTATNLEVGIEQRIVGKVQKPGVVAIPAKPMAQLLTSLSGETLTIEAKQHHTILHTPNTHITLLGLNPNDFPTLPTIKREHSFTLPLPRFISALERVLPAAATSDLKPELAGVFLSVQPTTLTLAATDSFRLAEERISDGVISSGAVECIIPFRTAQEVVRSLSQSRGEEVSIILGERQAVFEWDDARILSRLVDGTYPPYQAIIPTSFETTILVPRGELAAKIRLAAVFSSRLNDVTLQFSPTELEVSTTNTETGSTSARLSVKGRGSSGTAMFNYRYLADGLEVAGGESVVLNINGTSGPTLVQNPSDASFRYLVMPIRSV